MNMRREEKRQPVRLIARAAVKTDSEFHAWLAAQRRSAAASPEPGFRRGRAYPATGLRLAAPVPPAAPVPVRPFRGRTSRSECGFWVSDRLAAAPGSGEGGRTRQCRTAGARPPAME